MVTFLVLIGLIDFSPSVEAAEDCASIRREIRKTTRKIRKAKRIDNRARKQKSVRRLKKKKRKLRRQLAACLAMPAAAPAIFPIERVSVGNVGNDPDGSTGYGGVAYDFKIGKYEVTVEQYAAFLNAVAKTDTYHLYHTSMATAFGGLITRSGADGSYRYAVVGSGKRPITYVTWFDAARFCNWLHNWLHNGRPRGAQDAITTERGAYTLDGATTGVGFTRNPGADYWIPSEDEWYKAAFFDPRSPLEAGPPDGSHYWVYPTQDPFGPPAAEAPPGGGNSANFVNAVGGLTAVGAYPGSPSFYGTFDQGGNVMEWNDAVVSGLNRGLRGGSGDSLEFTLSSSFRSFFDPSFGAVAYGFRVASP